MQQINLYQPILRKQEKVFSLKTLLQGNLIILTALVLFYLVTLYQTHSLRNQHEALQQERNKRTTTLGELQQQFPAKARDQALGQRLEAQQALLNHRKRLLRELQQQNTGADGNPGFSEQLSGLARQDVEQIWLEQISVRDGKQLTLQGWASAPEEIPRLIQRLSTEPSFSGTAFTHVELTRAENDAALIGFRLHTDNVEGGSGQ